MRFRTVLAAAFVALASVAGCYIWLLPDEAVPGLADVSRSTGIAPHSPDLLSRGASRSPAAGAESVGEIARSSASVDPSAGTREQLHTASAKARDSGGIYLQSDSAVGLSRAELMAIAGVPRASREYLLYFLDCSPDGEIEPGLTGLKESRRPQLLVLLSADQGIVAGFSTRNLSPRVEAVPFETADWKSARYKLKQGMARALVLQESKLRQDSAEFLKWAGEPDRRRGMMDYSLMGGFFGCGGKAQVHLDENDRVVEVQRIWN